MDPNEWLMSAGGPPAISWRDRPVGYRVSGTICDESQVQQQRDPETGEDLWWDEAKTQAKMQLVVTIQTDERNPSIQDDDGRRRLFVKGKSLTEQTREAVKKSGRRGLEIGGVITVIYVGEGERTSKVKNPPHLFKVEYRPPADVASTSFFEHQPSMLAKEFAVAGASPRAAPPAGGTGPSLVPAAGAPPAGIDPSAWANLPDAQRGQILAAFAASGNNEAPPF